MEFKNLLYAVAVVIVCVVAYATFWILVALAVVFILYNIFQMTTELEEPKKGST